MIIMYGTAEGKRKEVLANEIQFYPDIVEVHTKTTEDDSLKQYVAVDDVIEVRWERLLSIRDDKDLPIL